MAKPPFPWIGSKEKIAPYILQLFPPKLTQYVEPFGGSGAVLLALPPDPNRLDIYNDLDAELVNLFSCIKECSNVLLRELKFLPIHGRKLFEYYRDFVAHKEVYFKMCRRRSSVWEIGPALRRSRPENCSPIFQERLALYDVKRAAAYYLAIRGSFRRDDQLFRCQRVGCRTLPKAVSTGVRTTEGRAAGEQKRLAAHPGAGPSGRPCLCRPTLCQNGAALPDRRKAGAFPQIPCPALANTVRL